MAESKVIVGGDVSGNIGSCEVKTTNVAKDSFHIETVAVNSCTGEIIARNSYYDWSYVYFPVMFVIVIVAILVACRAIFD